MHLYCGFSPWRQMAPQQNAKFRTAFFGQFRTRLRNDIVVNYASIWTLFSLSVTKQDVLCNALNISQIRICEMFSALQSTSCRWCRWRHKIRKIAVEILQSVNNRTQCLREIAYYVWLLLTYIVINTNLGRLTLDPAGMHCPSWDDAFVSSFFCHAPSPSSRGA